MQNITWKTIGEHSPSDLTEARLQLHYAVQLVAAAGETLTPAQPDASQASLSWDLDQSAFVGALIPAQTPFRIALHPSTLTVMIWDLQGVAIAALDLDQQTLAAGFDWLNRELAQLGVTQTLVPLTYPPDFPDHAIAQGANFDLSQTAALQAFADYYSNTAQLLTAIVSTTPNASPVRIWPHHFDMATLVSLPGTQNGEPKSVGLGFSPGDSSYNEPYWYVTPWPYPVDKSPLPPLSGNGFWHTQSWVGAVLRGSQLAVPDRAAPVQAFLTTAFQGAQVLLS